MLLAAGATLSLMFLTVKLGKELRCHGSCAEFSFSFLFYLLIHAVHNFKQEVIKTAELAKSRFCCSELIKKAKKKLYDSYSH